jgi:hypothetical protein
MSKVFSAIERVTPEMAVSFLANNPSNRSINPRAVGHLAEQMKQGLWCEHVSPIVFNERGALIDGQTRLSALIQYGKPLKMEIKRNVPDVVRPLIDTGRKRRASDWLLMLGIPNSSTVAGAARIFGAHKCGFLHRYWQRGDFETVNIQRIVEAHPSIVEFSRRALHADAAHIIAPSQHAGMSTIFAEKDAALAAVFCDEMGVGFEPSVYPAFHRVRETILKERAVAKSQLSRAVVLAYLIKGWNATRTGRTLRLVRWTPGVEAFPEIL